MMKDMVVFTRTVSDQIASAVGLACEGDAGRAWYYRADGRQGPRVSSTGDSCSSGSSRC